jgi:hypothetical protein
VLRRYSTRGQAEHSLELSLLRGIYGNGTQFLAQFIHATVAGVYVLRSTRVRTPSTHNAYNYFNLDFSDPEEHFSSFILTTTNPNPNTVMSLRLSHIFITLYSRSFHRIRVSDSALSAQLVTHLRCWLSNKFCALIQLHDHVLEDIEEDIFETSLRPPFGRFSLLQVLSKS